MNMIGIKRMVRPMNRDILKRFVSGTPHNVPTQELKGIKKLISVYGYSALIVYIGVTFISLPGCYFTVHSLGEERISIFINRGKQMFGYGEIDDDAVRNKVQSRQLERIKRREEYVKERLEEDNDNKVLSIRDRLQVKWDSIKTSPILTELILAYGLHKSLIFVRIPLTAAITPTLARYLPRAAARVNRPPLHTGTTSTSATATTLGDKNHAIYPKQQKTGFQKWFNGLF